MERYQHPLVTAPGTGEAPTVHEQAGLEFAGPWEIRTVELSTELSEEA
jgi:hypothetical protein